MTAAEDAAERLVCLPAARRYAYRSEARPASLGTSPISSQTVREFAPPAIDGKAKRHVGVTSYQFCFCLQ